MVGRFITSSGGGHDAAFSKYATTTINNRDLVNQLPARGDCEDYRFQPPLTTLRRNDEPGKSKNIQQHPEFLQRGNRHHRLAEGENRTRGWIRHPGRQRASRSIRQLAEQHVAVATRHAAVYMRNPPVKWVPAVVDGDVLRSLSRM